jgi:hypothetical protein
MRVAKGGDGGGVVDVGEDRDVRVPVTEDGAFDGVVFAEGDGAEPGVIRSEGKAGNATEEVKVGGFIHLR